MILLVLGIVASICLVGLRFVPSKLLCAGLLLQGGSLACNMAHFALILHWDTTDYSVTFPGALTYAYLPLILTILNAASLVMISYGMVRWRRARDARFIVLQVMVSGVAAYLLFNVSSLTGSILVPGSVCRNQDRLLR